MQPDAPQATAKASDAPTPPLDPFDKNAPPPRRDWRFGLGPSYIGTFFWIVFYDQLAVRTLSVGGLGWTIAGVVLGALLGRWMFYLAPALWGFRSGKPLAELSAATFGETGARFVPGLVVATASMAWFAIAIWFTTSTILLGLELLGLVSPGSTATEPLGPFQVHGGSFLLISLLWSIMIGLIGAFMTRLVSAIANVYPMFPAAALAVALLLTIRGLPSFSPTGIDPITGSLVAMPELWTLLKTAALVFAFSALPGLIGADWGSGSLTVSDVNTGGWVGLVLAPIITATLAMLIIAGSIGQKPEPASPISISLDPYNLTRPTSPEPAGPTVEELTMTHAIHRHIGGSTGGLILLLMGVGSSGMAAISAFLFSKRFSALRLGPSRMHWTILGALLAWPLVATGFASRLEPMLMILGATLAPLAAAITADFLLNRGRWPGPRRGINPAGWLAWIAGLAAGLSLTLAPLKGPAALLPAPIVAYVIALIVYLVVGLVGGLSKPVDTAPTT